MVFVVYTMEEDFGISWCTPWKGFLEFCGVHHGREKWFLWCTPWNLKMVFMAYTMEKDFGNFVVSTMEGNFRSSWCTPWKLKMVLMVYTMEEDFQIPWCRLTFFTPQKQILNLMVYTMEAENGFHGVHHGRGFWHFRGVHHGRAF